MYYFNFNLIKELPKLFGMPKSQLCKLAGVGVHAIDRWSESATMSVGKFVDFLNALHLSMADFLVPRQSPMLKKRKEDYVIPRELWSQVEWNCAQVAKTYGENSSTGVSSAEALVESLGMASRAIAVKWATDPYSMKVCTLIDLLNQYRLDARDFIIDRNRNIELPVWALNNRISDGDANALEKVLCELQQARAQLKDRDSLIASMKLELERVKRENGALRANGGREDKLLGGQAANSPTHYGNPFGKRKYVFHKELWESLPEIFGRNTTDFLREFGVPSAAFYSGNIRMDILIRVCNGLRMSITHFFPPEGEPLVVNHRTWYEISPHLFKPIESRMENLKFIFRRDTFGFTLDQLKLHTGLSNDGVNSLTREDGKSRMMLTLLDICNSFSIPMSSFVHDPNDRKRPSYSTSQNEMLIENCVKLAKALSKSQNEVKKLKAHAKEEQSNKEIGSN